MTPDSPFQNFRDDGRIVVEFFRRRRRGERRFVDATQRVASVANRVENVVVERHRLLPLDVVDF